MKNIARTYARMVWMAGILLALGTSCSKDMDETPARTVGQVTVSIASQSNLQTRTGLPVHDGEVDADWVQGVQHVTDVYLYVFEQDEDKKDFTCRSMYDVGWSESVDRTEDGKLPTETSSINYTIAYNFVVGKTYRLVAVGLDCAENVDEMQDFDGHNSALTYGLPESIQPGNKLSQAIATLQVGKTTEDMAHSEFFTGYIDYNPSTQGTNLETINLWRRVAGLQVCLNNIPQEVERVRILLYNSQNTEVNILPVPAAVNEHNKVADYITSPYGKDPFNEKGRVLMDKVFTEDVVDGNAKVGTSSDAYQCSMTAFILPMNIPDRERYDYTLVAEFITTSITGIVGTSKKVRLMKPWQNSDNLQLEDETDIGTGIIDDLDKYLFPIEANHFYCLGTRSNPIDCSEVLN